MRFKDIAGQQDIKNKLINSVKSGRISHAQLFLGPEGCGNLPMAIAFARYLSCINRGDSDSCGTCTSCIKYNKLIHPDLHFVFPVNTGKKDLNHPPVSDDYIAEWREILLRDPYMAENQWYEYIGIENKQGFIGSEESHQIIRKLQLKSFESDHKIMIIWLPEKMNQYSANKLLKIIEEPPEETYFIMVSESTQNMLPTILSRLQVVSFTRISDSDMKTALKEKYDLPDKSIDNLIHLSNGNYHKASEIIHSGEEMTFFLEKFIMLMRLAYQKNISGLVNLVDELHELGREKLKRFIHYSLKMVRENYIMNLKYEEMIYLTNEERDFSEKLHLFIHLKNVNDIYKLFNQASMDIESNAYARIVLLDIGLQLNEMLKKENDFA